ncbi:MAG: HAMP domain-containing histidine kinase [Pseudorhodobacter sp.]|nr:HAMP domain-containing histidine kinase [Frankiaceae bacterium]
MSDRTPLRTKLVAAVVLLSLLGLAVSAVAATRALRGYLQNRVDQQLLAYANGTVPVGGGRGGPGDDRFNTVYFRVAALGREVVPDGLAGPRVPALVPTRPVTVSARAGREAPWRIVGAIDRDGNPVVLGLSLGEVRRTTSRLLLLETVIGTVVLLALAGGGWLLVSSSLRPLAEVEQTAGRIAAGDLGQRVPSGDPRTEVGRLSEAFNTMIGRIELAFREREASEAEARTSEDRMRRFVADASHELRTPLTSIRGFAELYRQGALTEPQDVARAMGRVEDEAARMGLLVEDLLLLVRLDQQRALEHQPVDLLQLAGDAVHDASAVDPSRSVQLIADTPDAEPVVLGDQARLRQVVGNLVGNALMHTPPGTPVAVRVGTEPGWAVLDVVDAGPGIPAAARPRAFERFSRADASRTRAAGGSGLGLSIVAALVAAHAGTVEVRETPGGGATLRVRLPRQG